MDGTHEGDDRRHEPAPHADAPPAREQRTTGAGSEATEGTDKTGEAHDREHRGGYGGAGGAPVRSSDDRG